MPRRTGEGAGTRHKGRFERQHRTRHGVVASEWRLTTQAASTPLAVEGEHDPTPQQLGVQGPHLSHHQRTVGAGVVIGSNVFNLTALLGLGAIVAERIGLHCRVVIFGGFVALWVAIVSRFGRGRSWGPKGARAGARSPGALRRRLERTSGWARASSAAATMDDMACRSRQ